MLVIHFSETETCSFIYGGILIIFLTVCHTIAWYIFYIYLDFLSGIVCSHIRLRFIWLSYAWIFIKLHSANGTQHRLIAPFIAFFSQSVPQHNHIIIIWIMTFYEVIFLCCLFSRMMLRTVRMLFQTPPFSVISCPPPID